jgi:hypothetical protein
MIIPNIAHRKIDRFMFYALPPIFPVAERALENQPRLILAQKALKPTVRVPPLINTAVQRMFRAANASKCTA